ncbi:MAG: hypothetical protein NZM31_02985 [Gemmatales bacterium]|nr:hypothetical protein [Gemmatales bacterium]MDW8385965.1 hypothetical protein [Gemmatales bacterium]
MSRRRRSSEAPFGSDSFLDVLANLVGIVLIIIVLVGARIRHLPAESIETASDSAQPRPSAPLRVEMTEVKPDWSTEQEAVDELRSEVLRLTEHLSRQLIALETARSEQERLSRELVQREEQVAVLRREKSQWESLHDDAQRDVHSAESLKQSLKARLDALNRQIRSMETPRVQKRPLRYFLPVSRPLGAGELLFECRASRVTFIDLQSHLNQIRQRLPELAKTLTDRWETTGETEPVGPFKLRYKVVRERSGPIDQVFPALPPADGRAFSYALDEWEVVPVWPSRGEPVEDALAGGSRFRSVIDDSDPELAALTFFVYEDSFAGFRQLREYLHERGFVVAARPLRLEAPIAGSRRGTVSRGQ